VTLAKDGTLEKEGVTISFGRPILAEMDINPQAKTGKVAFFLDETDERRVSEF
jgi:hypothetical protein